jgi:16S rRNA (adenine1518-N6/adenine1519-N6)-dimethyltransferase
LLDELRLRPKRALGQNFLIDGNILDIIVDAAGIAEGDRILEIGPGLGALTERLLKRGADVLAVEKDHTLCCHLRRWFAGESRLELMEADALEVPADDLLASSVKVASNLPYSTGSRMLVALAQSARRPARMVVTVQKEVAARMAAAAGSRAYGLLGLWLQCDYHVDTVHTVKASCFYPRPEVDSAVMKLERRESRMVPDGLFDRFLTLTKKAFEHRRKRLAGTLDRFVGRPGGTAGWTHVLERAGIRPDARPEDVGPEEWALLAGLAGDAEGTVERA